MTRDAKIGLLLGLVFIFVIALIINGLPGLKRSDGNELTRTMARPNRPGHGIGTEARRIAQRTITPIGPVKSRPNAVKTQRTQGEGESKPAEIEKVRFEAELPKPTGARDVEEEITEAAESVKTKPALIAARQAKIEVNKTKRKPLQQARIYTVQEGDNLATIAKKFYGEEIGNRQAVIDMLFKANRKLLKRPDMIYVGQKLIVPPIAVLSSSWPTDVLKGEDFETAESVGKRRITTRTKSTDRYYTVKEGDSLWKIAEEQLGNGERYTELAKLNNLEDEDFLVVGKRLKLP